MSEKTCLLIGCGGRGRAHAEAAALVPRLKVIGLVDPNAEAAGSLRDEFFPGAPIYASSQEALANAAPDIAAISLWTGLHLSQVAACAQAGVRAIMCEKPIAPTWSECRELVRIAEQGGSLLVFSHQRRYARGNQMVRRLVQEGAFGQPLRLDLYSPPNILDCGTHTLDQAMSFMGEPSGKWVLGAVDASQPIQWFAVEADFIAVGEMVFDNGVRANIQCGGPDMDIWGGVRLTGTEGFVEVMWDGEIKRAVRYSDPSWQFPVFEADAGVDHMKAYFEDVIECLETGGIPETSADKAMRAAEIIFGFYLSARRRARVELPIPPDTGNGFHELLASGQLAEARSLGRASQS
jgi:predicted dehydrogenase